jgi:hypothetical protein
MAVFMFAVRRFIWLAATYAPEHVHGVQAGILGLSVGVPAAHVFTLKTAATAR